MQMYSISSKQVLLKELLGIPEASSYHRTQHKQILYYSTKLPFWFVLWTLSSVATNVKGKQR